MPLAKKGARAQCLKKNCPGILGKTVGYYARRPAQFRKAVACLRKCNKRR